MSVQSEVFVEVHFEQHLTKRISILGILDIEGHRKESGTNERIYEELGD